MIISMITIIILNYLIHDYDYDHDDNQDALQYGEYDNKVKIDFVFVNLLIGFNHTIFSHLLHFYELCDSKNILTVIIVVTIDSTPAEGHPWSRT